MKKFVLVFTAILSCTLLWVSCSKAEDLTQDIVVPVPLSVPVTFDTQLPLAIADTVNYVRYPEIPVNVDINGAIKSTYPAMSLANLKSAKISQFALQYKTSANGIKLDAVKSAKLYIKTPTLAPQLIAEADNNTSADILNFTPNSTIELSDYLKSDQKSFILDIQGNKIAADQLTLTLDSSFRLLVGL